MFGSVHILYNADGVGGGGRGGCVGGGGGGGGGGLRFCYTVLYRVGSGFDFCYIQHY